MTDRLLLRDARILACTGGRDEVPFDGDVLIEGGSIVEVAAGRIDVDRASTRVVDLAGSTVVPGLGDAHTHISWPLDFVFDHAAVAAAPPGAHMLDVAGVVRTYLESGYTLIIGAGTTQPLDDVMARESVERGLISGPRIVAGGTMIAEAGGLGSDAGLMDVVSDARGMREVVARQCDTGVRALKLFLSGDGIVPGFPSQDTYMDDAMVSAAVEEAERHGAFVTAHARSAASVALAARAGVRIVHHACFLDDVALAALAARRGDVWVCPGVHYLYAMVNGHAEPWGMTADRIEEAGYRGELAAQVEGLRALNSAGVPLVAGGDFGHQWTRHGTYAAEMERYVDLAGMTPVEALHTATRNTGAAAGLPVGQVRPGYLADLLVLDGDPSSDITVLQRPDLRRAVLKGGSFVYVNPGIFP